MRRHTKQQAPLCVAAVLTMVLLLYDHKIHTEVATT